VSGLLPEHLGLGPVLLLLVAAALAGWVDAVVGGGGLIQLPELLVLLPGAAPAQVLATNKLASICGTATSSVAYYRRVRPDLRTAIPTAICALGGAAGGAACASLLPKELFRPLVLVLLIGVALFLLRNPALGRDTKLRFSGHRHAVAAGAAGAAIGFYDGIFGPGTGTFLVFVFVGLLGYAFLEASALAKITNFATNLGALLVFVPAGAPLWGLGLGMGAANVAGAYLGARTAVARGNAFVRVVFLVVVSALVLRLGYDVVTG
jgi:uncharacterized membrane protein YfcA